MIKINTHIILIFLWAVFFSAKVSADVTLPSIFSNKMVLQQRSSVAIWGWADPGERISIRGSWMGMSVTTIADEKGNWREKLQTLAAGGPYSVNINGKNSIELTDVLIGEVWICSGQSNMVFKLKASENANAEIAVADLPMIRFFNVKRQYGPGIFKDAVGTVWETTTAQSASAFSAVAYYFAKKINKELNVPVGIVYSAWGGTPAEAWTPKETLKNDELLKQYIYRWDTILQRVGADSAAFNIALNNWETNKKNGITHEKKPAEPQTFYYYKRPWREPGVLYNGMIEPFISYSIKGILWYQGESNVAFADEYEHLSNTMIKSWREKNDAPILPFYFVQISPFKYSNMDAAARLRMAQYEITKKVPHTGMVVTVDVGNMKDQHPTRKKEVGERLALLALNKSYGFKKLKFSGPGVKKIQSDKQKIKLTFDQKLFTHNKQKPGGFEIGYKDVVTDSIHFVKAESRITDRKVIVWNATITHPVMIRYAWLLIEEANLVNDAGLPAFPFSEKIN